MTGRAEVDAMSETDPVLKAERDFRARVGRERGRPFSDEEWRDLTWDPIAFWKMIAAHDAAMRRRLNRP